MDESTKARRKSRASRERRSTDDGAPSSLNEPFSTTKDRSPNLADEIHGRFAAFGGVELADVPREPIRRPPDFI